MTNSITALKVSTRPFQVTSDLISYTKSSEPLVWLKDGRGFVGFGEASRFSFSGPTRFKDAALALKELGEISAVHDEIKDLGTGLTAFGAFAFDDESTRESVLIVPRYTIGFGEKGGWITSAEPLTDTESLTGVKPPTSNASQSTGAHNTEDSAADSAADSVADFETEAYDPEVEAYGHDVIASFIEPSGEAAAYREGVLAAAAKIERGEAQKIVLARRLQAEIPADADLRVPLKKLHERYTDCWTFAVDGMVGASPETLIRSVDNAVSARVLAGTRKRSLDKERDEAMREELRTSKKELFEHRLAIESLVEALTPFVSELQFDADPYLLKLPNVWHLASNVSARLDADAQASELAGAVHPTAAVAGTPTATAITAIKELEPFDRERYAGAVGWANADGDGDWAIALRSAQIDDITDSAGEPKKLVTAFAGGGLVAGSDPWHELTETVAKFRPIIEAFS